MYQELDLAGVEPQLHWPMGTTPIVQAARWVPERLYDWQCDILQACQRRGARRAVVTPNGSGKTSVLIPVLGLSWMAAFPGCQVVSTAGVERQIKKALWPKLRAATSRYKQWSCADGTLTVKAPPAFPGVPGSEWFAFSAKDPFAAEGYHPRWYENHETGEPVYCPLVVIVDEGKAFHDEDLLNALIDRCNPDVALFISTPGEDTGPFYDAFHLNRNDPWRCHEITWADCLHLRHGFELEVRDRKIRKLGRQHPFVKSWVFGEFFAAGHRRVFDRVEDIRTAMSSAIPWVRGQRHGACEFSGGGDEQVFGVREGNRVVHLEAFHEPDDTRLAQMLSERFQKWDLRAENITADNGGAGKTCIDILESKGWQGINRYLFNGEAQDKTQFYNRAMEDHYEVRAKMIQSSLILPDDPVLFEQMRTRRYKMRNDDGVMQLEEKKKVRDRNKPSPDRLDTIVMLTADMPTVTFKDVLQHAAEAAKDSRCGFYRDCLNPPDDTSGDIWPGEGFMDG